MEDKDQENTEQDGFYRGVSLPEFKTVVEKIAHDALREINKEAPKVESEMPYKTQYVLEEVIKILNERV